MFSKKWNSFKSLEALLKMMCMFMPSTDVKAIPTVKVEIALRNVHVQSHQLQQKSLRNSHNLKNNVQPESYRLKYRFSL